MTTDTDFDPSWPYAVAQAQLAEGIDGLRVDPRFSVAPASGTTLVIEEAFAIMACALLGTGLDEEAVTAGFMSALAGAARGWARHWIWAGRAGGEICWVHYNKASENKIGADFALFIADETCSEPEQPCFRVIVVQAKLLGSDAAISVSRPGWKPDKTKEGNARLRDEADSNLLARLRAEDPAATPDLTRPQWQLAKLIALRDRLARRAPHTPAPAFVYALWPQSSTEEPLYRTLEAAIKDILADRRAWELLCEPPKRLAQSLQVDPKARLRDWLLEQAGGDGLMTLAQAKATFGEIQDLCTASIVIDAGASGLAAKLTDKPALQPRQDKPVPARSGLKSGPGSGMP